MTTYSLAIAWNWEYDEDFIRCLDQECSRRQLSVLHITPSTLAGLTNDMQAGAITIRALYDRASDDDEAFYSVVTILEKRAAYIVNPHKLLERARDKATMHLELISAGLHVPFTIIISPFNQRKEVTLTLSELEQLGRPFIIKPANTTGGGIGVVLGAETLRDIIESRQHHKDDKYLLQETIYPAVVDGRRAWFRLLYAYGQVFPCWWDDQTHIYTELTTGEEEWYHLAALRRMMHTIQSICKLDFFSSEVALAPDGRLVVIDYVNEICDMRLQSLHPDGVPDRIVREVAGVIVQHIAVVVGQTAV